MAREAEGGTVGAILALEGRRNLSSLREHGVFGAVF